MKVRRKAKLFFNEFVLNFYVSGVLEVEYLIGDSGFWS